MARSPHLARRPRLRLLLLSSAIAGVAAGPLPAQEEPSPIFVSSLVPNYDRIRIGQVEGLEGGAYIARTGDAGANWYNPAGLAGAEKSGLNASANAYEYTTVNLEGLGAKFGSGRFRSVGTYVGGVMGSPPLKGSSLRLGFSFTRPVVWSPGPITGEARFGVPGGGSEQITYSSRVGMSTSVPAIAAGLRLTEGLRIGATAGMAITDISVSQVVTERLTEIEGLARRLRSVYVDGQSWDLQLGGGAQWDVVEAVRLGATVTSPGLRIAGSGLVEDQLLVGEAGGGSVDLMVRDPEATFDYRQPLRVAGGVAVRLGALEIEADIRYFGSREDYALIETDSTVQVLLADPDGNVTAGEVDTPPVLESTRAVTNLALGANYSLSPSFRLHAGFYTDRSPVGNPNASLFRAVDLTGITAGISFGGRLSGSIGLSTNWGTTDERSVGTTLSGASGLTRVSISTFNLHYALSYSF